MLTLHYQNQVVPTGLDFSLRLEWSNPAARLDAIPGAVPHPLDLPKGCKFAPRCKYCTQRCMAG